MNALEGVELDGMELVYYLVNLPHRPIREYKMAIETWKKI